jgi:polyisoprenoid-binding protein YceI
MSTTAEQTTRIPTGTWELDPIHSGVGFAVTYSGAGTVRGGFNEFDAKLIDGKLEGSAKVASVSFDEPQLVGHLQSPDFFDAEQFPELRFASKPIVRNGDEITVEGELTLRGVTKPVTISGTVVGPTADVGVAGPIQRIAFDVETKVDRREFGINWNRELPTGDPALGNDVKITANLALYQAA